MKSINILVALRWVAKALLLVKPETISKCFRKAGILLGWKMIFFLEADVRMEVQSLIEKTMPAGGRCDLDEYLHGDDDLPVCMDLDNDSWETDLLDQLGQDEEEADKEEDEGEDEMDIEPPPSKILNYK